MIYRCYLKCPHNAEPCEMARSEYEYNMKSTPCPIGEYDGFQLADESNEFFLLILGYSGLDDYGRMKKITNELLMNKGNRDIVVVSDRMNPFAEKFAKEHNYPIITFSNREYEIHLGMEKNEQAHRYISKKRERGVIAFCDGSSADVKTTLEMASRYKNQIRIYDRMGGCFIKRRDIEE